MDLLEDILKLKKKGKKDEIDNDFEDMPNKSYEEDAIGPLDKIKALDDILKGGSVSIEKIEIKKKKKDEDDEDIDLPAMVSGSY